MGRRISRLNYRALLLYLCTIVLPVCGLLWLGLQSFERQRQAFETLTAERFARELEVRVREGVEAAFFDEAHPAARHRFVMEQGIMVEPVMRSPLPRTAPPELAAAEHQELAQGRPDLALRSYRALLRSRAHDSLVKSRIARCLEKLGLADEARAAWRSLARDHADDRDLSNRPFGIVAAIHAGDSDGLFELISSGRWALSADQAEFFLTKLDPARTSAYLERFRFAARMQERLRPPSPLREGELHMLRVGEELVAYRADTTGRLSGIAVSQDWMDRTLRPQLAREMGRDVDGYQAQWLYGGALALVLLVLSAGVFLLLRDVSREAQANRLRAEFVSGVSHELKTPITLIRLYGETLLRHAVRPLVDAMPPAGPFGPPRMSPTGREVAFAWEDTSGGTRRFSLRLMGLDAANPRTLLESDMMTVPIGWSSDGRSLLVVQGPPASPSQSAVLVSIAWVPWLIRRSARSHRSISGNSSFIRGCLQTADTSRTRPPRGRAHPIVISSSCRPTAAAPSRRSSAWPESHAILCGRRGVLVA